MRKFVTITAIIFLLIALLVSGLPYGFFTLLRFVIFSVGVYSAWTAFNARRMNWGLAFAFLAIVFNPFVPIFLDRSMWIVIDLFATLFLSVSVFAFRVIQQDELKLDNIIKNLDKLFKLNKSQIKELEEINQINFSPADKEILIATDDKFNPYQAKSAQKNKPAKSKPEKDSSTPKTKKYSAVPKQD